MIEHITPKPACRACYGRGIVRDRVPYGSTVAYLESICECVYEQMADPDDNEVEIEEASSEI